MTTNLINSSNPASAEAGLSDIVSELKAIRRTVQLLGIVIAAAFVISIVARF